jgi:diguanylate cyclase (GGDEF)-like protein
MDIQMIVTYIDVDLFCMIMACVMSMNLNSDFGSESEVRTLQKALASYCGFLLFGLVWLLTQNGYLIYSAVVAWISNCLSLFLMNMTSFFWCIFAVTKLSRGRVLSRERSRRIFLIPIAISALICALSPWTGWAFTITSGGGYQRGPLFVPVSSVGYLYDLIVCIYAIYCAFHEKQSERRKLCWVIGFFIVFPMTAGVIQIVITGTPILAPAIIISLFLVFVTIQSSQIYNDAMTGLNNRKRAFAYLEKELAATGPEDAVIVYMTDVDNFKLINDRQGHVEGDRALRAFADVLSLLASRYDLFVARYGGDEFIIIDRGRHCADPETVVADMKRQLRAFCDSNPLKYELTVSVGYAKTSDRNTKADDMIRMADRKMYEAKSTLHGNP